MTEPAQMPWKQDTPQVNGRKAEKEKAKQYGAILHTNSGAGKWKQDFSTDEAIYEDKNVAKSHTLNGDKLNEQLQDAIQQGKEARYIVYFIDANVTLEGVIRRGS